MEPLSGVALVTGAARGIGRAIALGLAQRGSDVVVNYANSQREAEEVAQQIQALGRRAAAVRADVSRATDVAALFDQVQEFGRLDVLVNNAAVMERSHFLELNEAAWDTVIDTNLKGYFLCSQAAARLMARQDGGRIIHVSSVAQIAVVPNMAAYITAKGGVAALSRAIALELAPYDITSNVVAPGTIETDINRQLLRDPEFRRMKTERIPLGHLGAPEDVVGAVLFLASPAARYVTGSCLTVDGGLTVWSDNAPRHPAMGYPVAEEHRRGSG